MQNLCMAMHLVTRRKDTNFDWEEKCVNSGVACPISRPESVREPLSYTIFSGKGKYDQRINSLLDLRFTLKQEWERIPKELLQNLFESLQRRLQAVK